MADPINRIGISPNQITANYAGSNNTKPEVPEEKEPEAPKAAPEYTPVPASDVLDMLAAQGAINITPGVKYDVSKYVTPEQEARIAAFMKDFEAAVAEGLIDIDKELGDVLSPGAKSALAAELVQ